MKKKKITVGSDTDPSDIPNSHSDSLRYLIQLCEIHSRNCMIHANILKKSVFQYLYPMSLNLKEFVERGKAKLNLQNVFAFIHVLRLLNNIERSTEIK